MPSLEWIEPAVRAAQSRAPGAAGLPVVVVRVDEQRLYLWDAGRVTEVYDVSTAWRGVGSEEGTYRTPPGLHRVAERHGSGARPGTIFRARTNTGRLARILTGPDERSAEDNITSRILWLEGLEPGRNRGGSVDSFARYIYIHGTDEEGRIGTPASKGCIRMRNRDVIELFAVLPPGALVLILEGPDYDPAGSVLVEQA
ncbi:MAG: L,D-transpeptidase family protein [Pseudomonadota bacterium]